MPKQVYPGGPGTLPIGSMASIFKCQHFWNLADGIIYQMGIQLCTLSKAIIWFWKGAIVLFSALVNPGKIGRNLGNQQYTVNFSLLRADKLSIAFVGITRRHRHETLLRLWEVRRLWFGFQNFLLYCSSKIPVKKLRIQQLNFCWQISARSFFRANSWKRKQISRAIGQFVFSRVGGWLATWLRFLV